MKGTGTKLTSANRHGIAFATIALSGVAFWNPLSRLLEYALSHESSSHILIIPIISIYFFISQRRQIFQETRWCAAAGVPTIGAGIAGLLFVQRFLSTSARADYLFAATLSIVTILCGEFLLFYGGRAARAAAFPLAFLALMVPMPEAALAGTIHFLQGGSISVTCLMFKIAGVPYVRQGFVLSLPTISIEIAKECSGIRSSIALVITCLLAAKLFLRSYWKMTFLVLLAIPFAILKNGMRITTLTLLSIDVNPSFLTGKLHRQGGFVFFLITLGMLAAGIYFLRKSEGKSLASPRQSQRR
ncbi:MAG: exosortase/archaeosortase family protein [Candidatus Acidiferrales bacterium]